MSLHYIRPQAAPVFRLCPGAAEAVPATSGWVIARATVRPARVAYASSGPSPDKKPALSRRGKPCQRRAFIHEVAGGHGRWVEACGLNWRQPPEPPFRLIYGVPLTSRDEPRICPQTFAVDSASRQHRRCRHGRTTGGYRRRVMCHRVGRSHQKPLPVDQPTIQSIAGDGQSPAA